jgi:predicted N-acetyltransferase YhbS
VIIEAVQLTDEQWAELRAGEERPFDGGGLQWRDTQGSLALRVGDRLVATASWAIVDLEAREEPFQVVGLGAVLVSRPHRGKGYVRRILEPWLERAKTLGPARAALFCAPRLEGMYGRFGFAAVEAPVTADQPSGPVTMPQTLMWRPLQAGATWPDGPIRVRGLPF